MFLFQIVFFRHFGLELHAISLQLRVNKVIFLCNLKNEFVHHILGKKFKIKPSFTYIK